MGMRCQQLSIDIQDYTTKGVQSEMSRLFNKIFVLLADTSHFKDKGISDSDLLQMYLAALCHPLCHEDPVICAWHSVTYVLSYHITVRNMNHQRLEELREQREQLIEEEGEGGLQEDDVADPQIRADVGAVGSYRMYFT